MNESVWTQILIHRTTKANSWIFRQRLMIRDHLRMNIVDIDNILFVLCRAGLLLYKLYDAIRCYIHIALMHPFRLSSEGWYHSVSFVQWIIKNAQQTRCCWMLCQLFVNTIHCDEDHITLLCLTQHRQASFTHRQYLRVKFSRTLFNRTTDTLVFECINKAQWENDCILYFISGIIVSRNLIKCHHNVCSIFDRTLFNSKRHG